MIKIQYFKELSKDQGELNAQSGKLRMKCNSCSILEEKDSNMTHMG